MRMKLNLVLSVLSVKNYSDNPLSGWLGRDFKFSAIKSKWIQEISSTQ